MGKKGGKFKKKQTMRSKFAENAAEIEVNNERYASSAAERWERRKDLDGSGDEGEEGEEGKEGGEGGGVLGAAAGMGRMVMESESSDEEVEKVFKPKGVAAFIETANPNAVAAAGNKNVSAKNMGDIGEVQLTRREREAVEEQVAARANLKAIAKGETPESAEDLARLKAVQERRAEARAAKEKAAAEKEAEKKRKEEQKEEEKANRKKNKKDKKKKKKVESSEEEAEFEELDPIAIKKMKPPMLKMLLKERGLSITGNKKNLADRLLEFNEEAAL